MSLKQSQAGFGHIVAVLLVVVVAGVAFAGYTVYKAGQKTDTAATTSANLPATIQTKADLTATGNYLDNTATELNTNLDPSSLDSDIDQLL